MDISSLPEAEQQKLQQLQIRFQEHQAQQQQAQQEQQQPQNQQDHASQPYDPSQYHQYQDQSAQSYDYAPYQHYPQQNQPPHHHYEQHFDQHYAYYQPDYANTYPPQQQYAPPDPAQPQVFVAGPGPVQQQQNVYYPTQPAQGGGGEPPSSVAYPGLNAAAAAAVAALSQLTHFAGTMVAAEKAMFGPPYVGHGPVPSPPARSSRYGDGGRRGGGPSRGRGQRRGGPGPSFRGGRGRDRARRGPVHVPSNDKSSHSEPPVAKDGEIINEEAGPSAPAPETAAPASVLADTSSAASSAGKVAAKQKPKQAATCELCKIECTSLEILEVHKNGKRHKKNMLRIEELKNAIKPVPAIQIEQNSDVSQQPETQQNCEENKLMEGLTVEVEAGGDKNQVETEEQNHTGSQSEGPVVESSDTQTVKLKVDRSNSKKDGKRKIGGAQGGRRLKPKVPVALRRPIEPRKPKVQVALICELCNAKCDTREVLDRHLSGKKHIAKLKRFQGHQAHNGQTGLRALYPPPNPIVQTLFHPQDHQQHFYPPQSSFPPPGAYMPPQGPHGALPSASGIDPQLQTIPQTHGSVATLDPGTQNAVAVVAQQLQIQ